MWSAGSLVVGFSHRLRPGRVGRVFARIEASEGDVLASADRASCRRRPGRGAANLRSTSGRPDGKPGSSRRNGAKLPARRLVVERTARSSRIARFVVNDRPEAPGSLTCHQMNGAELPAAILDAKRTAPSSRLPSLMSNERNYAAHGRYLVRFVAINAAGSSECGNVS